MLIEFTIPLETPSKKNSRIVLQNGKNIPSARYREWENSAYIILKAQKKNLSVPIESLVTVRLRFTHKDKKRRDSDNQASSVLDLLQESGILKDDCWQIVRRIEIQNRQGKSAECRIEITDFQSDQSAPESRKK